MLIFLSMLETDIERQQFLELYEQYGNAMLLVARKFSDKIMGWPRMQYRMRGQEL